MLVGILEITSVPAPEGRCGWLHDPGPRSLGLYHHRIHFGLTANIVAERHLGSAARRLGQPGVVRQIVARPKRQLQARLELKECDRPMLKLPTDDSLGRLAQAVPVECDRRFQVVNAECDQRNAWLHEEAPSRRGLNFNPWLTPCGELRG